MEEGKPQFQFGRGWSVLSSIAGRICRQEDQFGRAEAPSDPYPVKLGLKWLHVKSVQAHMQVRRAKDETMRDQKIIINIVLSTSYFLYKLANCNCTGISMPEHVKISTVMVWSYHASCNWHGMIIPMQLQLAWYDHTCPSWWKNSFKLQKKSINYKKIHENL